MHRTWFKMKWTWKRQKVLYTIKNYVCCLSSSLLFKKPQNLTKNTLKNKNKPSTTFHLLPNTVAIGKGRKVTTPFNLGFWTHLASMSPNKRVFGVKEHNSKEHKSKHFYIHIKKMQYQKPTNTLPAHVKILCYKQLPTQAIRKGDKRRFFFIEWTLVFIMYLCVPGTVWAQNDMNRKKEQWYLYTCFKVHIFTVELRVKNI